MKKWFCLSLFAAISCFAGFVNCPRQIALEKGCIVPLESGKILFDADFMAKSSNIIGFGNYENKLAHCFEVMDGSPVLVIRNPKRGTGDTAWNFRTRKIALKGTEKRLLLEIDCKAANRLKGNRDDLQWANHITWFNAEGKAFRHTKFTYCSIQNLFVLTQIPFDVPAEATALTIQIGCDAPDINGTQYQAYRKLRLMEGAPDRDYTGTASFVSRVFQGASGKVSWKGDFPAGSHGQIRVAWAPDDGGCPGKWTRFLGPDGTANSFYDNGSILRNIPASAKWFRYEFTFRSRKKRPVLKEVRVGSFTDREWLTFFDTLPPLVLNTTSSGRDFRKPITVKVQDESPINWKSLRFVIDDKDVTKNAVVRDNTITYTPKKTFADRIHSFTVTLSDMEGNKIQAKRYFSFEPVPEKNIVTLRDDGLILIDGKPFFPIGIYAMAKKPWNGNSYDRGCRDVKEAGFNTIHTYCSARIPEFYNEFFPAAKKYGLKLFIAGPKGANSHDLNLLLNTIRKEKSNPDILSWYLADDTVDYWTPDELAEFDSAVRAVDPSRPTCQANGVHGYPGFPNCTAIYLPEIYPVTTLDSGDRCVARVIHDMQFTFDEIRRNGSPNVSVWAIIQYFKGWGHWKRFPTARELRAMNYASIIHGAHGITWYTYAPGDHRKHRGAASTPENWKIMSAAAKELYQLIPVFCERKAKVQPAVKILSGPEKDLQDHPSVTGLLKIHNGKSYWITVNSTVKPVTASFTLPGLKGGKVLFENRNVTVKNGVLTDKFAPYDVHVYELTK